MPLTEPTQRLGFKAFVQQTAQDSGMSEESAIAFAEKCYDAPIWEPYGGAESFEEIDSQRAADQYQMNVNMENYALQGIISNVMQDENLNAGEKSARIQAAAAAFEERINRLDVTKPPPVEGTKNLKGDFLTRLKERLLPGEKKDFSGDQRKKLASTGAAMSDGSFPIQSAGDVKNAVKDWGRAGSKSSVKSHIIKRARAIGATSALPDDWVSGKKEAAEEVDLGKGFKMFVDTNGELRWLAFSSNAFEDNSKEVFSTKALEDAIDYSEKVGDRGPLQVFHVPGTQIGNCDFQAMSGRFLVESGTFDNTLMGQKAVQYFEQHPEVEWQVSVGYFYKEHDDKDGTYDWMRIKERSILPVGTADNPYTGFWTQQTGEKAMHSKAKATLEDLFGPEITANVITQAEEGTKALEEAGIRFKMGEDEFGDITGVEEIAVEGSKAEPEVVVLAHEHGTIRHTHRVKMESEHEHQDLKVAYKAAKKTPAADAEDAADNGADDAQEDANGKKKAPPFAKKEGEDLGSDGMVKLATVFGAVLTDVESIKESLKEVPVLMESVKALKASDDERMASFMSNRMTFPGGIRPTESTGNVVDATKTGVKEIVEDPADKPVNPAAIYVQDLLGRNSIQQG